MKCQNNGIRRRLERDKRKAKTEEVALQCQRNLDAYALVGLDRIQHRLRYWPAHELSDLLELKRKFDQLPGLYLSVPPEIRRQLSCVDLRIAPAGRLFGLTVPDLTGGTQ